MSSIGAIKSGVGSVGMADHPSKPAESKDSTKLHEMSKQFEAMFVRQILSAAKIGGGGKQNAYGGMGVDALASGITEGNGLGLAREIEDTVRRAEHMTASSSAPSAGSAANAANPGADASSLAAASLGAVNAASAAAAPSTNPQVPAAKK